VFTSTNKVYGCLPDLPMRIEGDRWRPVDDRLAARGIDEARPLEFRTPYGCSKGAADQYVLDYAQSFGVPATVFRMSCIYGPHQFGTEDQGWVAHFLIRALSGEPITIYGDGRQVRDILYVDDLVEAFLGAWARIGAVRGRAFNIGGGPRFTISLLELLAAIERLHGRRPDVRDGAWRAGDQRYYVSDTRAFTEATGWQPRVAPRAGIERLHGWLVERGAGRREHRGEVHA
jgi:CDP-paratose 2-epimerase